MDEAKPIEGLIEGRIVHYVLPAGRNTGYHRPAIIVQVWDIWSGKSNLRVFLDGDNDDPERDLIWATSIAYSEDKKPGTWHFIERD